MAVPITGKCLILLVLALIICTGYTFRIRDAVTSNVVEHSRGCTGSAKCTIDGTPLETSSTSSTGTLSAVTRKLTFGSDGSRGRNFGKTRQPPAVVDDDSEESLIHADSGHLGKTSALTGKLEKWIGSEVKRIKAGRVVVKVDEDDEGSDQDVVTEEDDDEEDADDDGVEISNGDEDSEEESEELIGSEADDDDDDDDDEEEEIDEESEELSNENDDEDNEEEDNEDNESEEETKSDDDNVEDDNDSDETVTIVGRKVIEKDRISKLEDSKFSTDTREREDSVSRKITREKKVVDSEDQVTNVKNDDSSKQQSGVTKESKREKESAGSIKVQEEKRKKVLKMNDAKESDEDEDEDDEDEDEDDDEEDDDDEEQVLPASVTPAPLRKLEKVRLADKEKSKSTETINPVKTVITEPKKSTIPEVVGKSTNETRTRKKKSIDATTRDEKYETEQSTNQPKPETKVKPDDVSLKLSKNAPSSSVKSEISKKSTDTKDAARTKVEKGEKVIVEKTKDKSTRSEGETKKKSENLRVKIAGDDVKKIVEKIDDDVGTEKKSSIKPKKRTDATISLTELNDSILRVPTFVPNFTAVEDPICQQHGKIFLRQLRGYKLWALQMLDSSAKIPSGLLRGNVNQLGDFDQCLGITARVKVDDKTIKVQGKYCLATLDIHATISDTKVPVNLMQSRGFIRASMRDPGHFVPRFTTANWAMCIPAACSAEDAQSAIESALSNVNISSGLRFSINVDPEMCYVRQKSQSYTKETIGVLYFYAMIICVVLVATVRDYFVCAQEKGNYSERIIMSFSLRRTVKILTKEENPSAGDISCIHGIRTLATIALYIAHKMIPTSQIPYANRIYLTEIANNPMSSLLRTSLAYTDCFLLLSGLLTAFNMARETTKRGEIRWFCRFVARFIRLTPALLIMVFWYAYVMEHTGNGPQWNRVIATNTELCKQNSWTNLLYIQNFFPFEEMCATHTHQLALDMQLSLIAPILVFFLTLKPIIGILVMFFILQVSATIRYFATTNNYLSLVIYHGMTMKQLYKTANLTYALPLHRATPYVFGVGLGVLLHWTGKNVRIYRIFVIFGWLLATCLTTWSLFSPWRMAKRDYVYDVEDAAHYAVIAPVTWSLGLCWIIFACFTNHGGIVNKFLSSYWMIVFSRISYAVYLCQFAIFFYNVGTTRYSSELQIHRFIDPYEAIVVTLVSVFITLIIDIPMQEVKNVIMESTDGLSVPIIHDVVNDLDEKASSKQESTTPHIDESVPEKHELQEEEEEEEEEVVKVGLDRSESWYHQDDATDDGLTRFEDSGDEIYMEKWRPKLTSKEQKYTRRERYEEDDDPEDIEESVDDEDEDERPTEWSWVRRDRGRISMEDDGLPEQRTNRSEKPEFRRSSSRQYQREDDDGTRHERRSTSRQAEKNPTMETPRNSMKRERSKSRGSEARIRQPEMDDPSFHKRSIVKSRDNSINRDQERSAIVREATRRELSSPPTRERSTTRQLESDRIDDVKRRRSEPRERSRHERSPSRSPVTITRTIEPIVRSMSSESEDETTKRSKQQRTVGKVSKKQQQRGEPKISDEEDWEQELRIRRRKFMERLASEDREVKMDDGNDGWNLGSRRSSAEGKLALLKDPTGSNVMDSWTVSRGTRVSQLGSSQETEDDTTNSELYSPKKDPDLRRESFSKDRSEDEASLEQTRRHSYTSGSQVTSLEEEDEDNDFVLNKDSKRITVMDLSKLSQQEEITKFGTIPSVCEEQAEVDDSKPIMATLKLFKRESIVKSQASEEDPEYLLPERPKLMEQEQDHPFKKAWQLQKSRSEEDPMAYSLKEVKQDTTRKTKKVDKNNDDAEDSVGTRDSSGGPRTILEEFKDSGEEDIWLEDRSDDGGSSSKSTNDDSSRLDWLPSVDERFDRRGRQKDEIN